MEIDLWNRCCFYMTLPQQRSARLWSINTGIWLWVQFSRNSLTSSLQPALEAASFLTSFPKGRRVDKMSPLRMIGTWQSQNLSSLDCVTREIPFVPWVLTASLRGLPQSAGEKLNTLLLAQAPATALQSRYFCLLLVTLSIRYTRSLLSYNWSLFPTHCCYEEGIMFVLGRGAYTLCCQSQT